MSAYYDEVRRAMAMIAQEPNAIFMGQAVAYPGTAMFGTLEDVPAEKRLELPVMEDTQMGMAIGMSLAGLLPVCIYPRINFLLLAINQLVLHLDKLPTYSQGGYRPKVIVRTAIGSASPLDPGAQHLGDYSLAIKLMLRTVAVVRIDHASEVHAVYKAALRRDGPTVVVEKMEHY